MLSWPPLLNLRPHWQRLTSYCFSYFTTQQAEGRFLSSASEQQPMRSRDTFTPMDLLLRTTLPSWPCPVGAVSTVLCSPDMPMVLL